MSINIAKQQIDKIESTVLKMNNITNKFLTQVSELKSNMENVTESIAEHLNLYKDIQNNGDANSNKSQKSDQKSSKINKQKISKLWQEGKKESNHDDESVDTAYVDNDSNYAPESNPKIIDSKKDHLEKEKKNTKDEESIKRAKEHLKHAQNINEQLKTYEDIDEQLPQFKYLSINKQSVEINKINFKKEIQLPKKEAVLFALDNQYRKQLKIIKLEENVLNECIQRLLLKQNMDNSYNDPKLQETTKAEKLKNFNPTANLIYQKKMNSENDNTTNEFLKNMSENIIFSEMPQVRNNKMFTFNIRGIRRTRVIPNGTNQEKVIYILDSYEEFKDIMRINEEFLKEAKLKISNLKNDNIPSTNISDNQMEENNNNNNYINIVN